ncbi:MAG: response regulator [bacterium]
MARRKKENKPRVLVVDDEELIRTTLEIKLSSDFDVTIVSSGDEAIERIAAESFDVILTDLKMMGADGLDVLRAARQTPEGPDVIILTGYASLESALEALRQEAFDYLIKPVDHARLQRALLRAVERRRLAAENRAMMAENERLREFYETLLNQIEDALFVVDSSLQLVAANRSCQERIFEGKSAKVNVPVAEVLPAWLEAKGGRLLESVLKQKTPQVFEATQSSNGILRHYLVRLQPLKGLVHDPKGGLLALLTDVTPLKQLAQAESQAKKLEGISQMAVTLNHEINNPLGIALGQAHLLKEDILKGDPSWQERLSIIEEQIHRIAKLTQKLRQISSAKEGDYIEDRKMIVV